MFSHVPLLQVTVPFKALVLESSSTSPKLLRQLLVFRHTLKYLDHTRNIEHFSLPSCALYFPRRLTSTAPFLYSFLLQHITSPIFSYYHLFSIAEITASEFIIISLNEVVSTDQRIDWTCKSIRFSSVVCVSSFTVEKVWTGACLYKRLTV